jgi:hypothetical protein
MVIYTEKTKTEKTKSPGAAARKVAKDVYTRSWKRTAHSPYLFQVNTATLQSLLR